MSKVLNKFEDANAKTHYFVSGGGGFMPDEKELKEREALIVKAIKGNKKAKLDLMSPPYSLSYFVRDGKRII